MIIFEKYHFVICEKFIKFTILNQLKEFYIIFNDIVDWYSIYIVGGGTSLKNRVVV